MRKKKRTISTRKYRTINTKEKKGKKTKEATTRTLNMLCSYYIHMYIYEDTNI